MTILLKIDPGLGGISENPVKRRGIAVSRSM
jgi:hypothetical protein